MKSRRILPWFFLSLLLFLIVFSAGVRRGSYVEKENMRKQIQNQRASSTISTASATLGPVYKRLGGPCNVHYLLPGLVASESANIEIQCDTQSASAAGELTKQGYEKTPVPKSNPILYVWTRIPTEFRLLVQESLQVGSE